MSEYQFLFTQAGDTEGSPFRMIFVLEDETNGFSYGASLIRGPIYIVDRNRASKFLQIKPAAFHIVSVDKFSSSSAVYQGIDRFPLGGVCSLEFDFQFQGARLSNRRNGVTLR